MAHVRAQIRAAVVAALTGLTTTGARVYSGRSRPLAKDHAPVLLVYSTDEQQRIDASGAPPRLERDLSLVVEGRAVATAADALEELLDTISMEVEQEIFLDPSVGGRARSIDLVRSTHLVADDPAERLTGAVRMEFLITYRTPEGDPQTAV